jgi:hypothetical protein
LPAILFAFFVIAGLLFVGYKVYRSDGAEKEPQSEELDLCRRFMALKNDRDPRADDLLGPAPIVPQEAISPEEAARIDADTFLRAELRVVDVQPSGSAEGPRFILVTKGSGVGAMLHVRSGDKVDRVQRVVQNTALLVEARDGKIYGVRTQLPPP